MGAFLIKQYVDSGVPDTIMEAARIDGANVFVIYWRIIMPMIKPAWMTQLLFSGDLVDYPYRGNRFQRKSENIAVCYGVCFRRRHRAFRAAMACTVLLMLPPILVYFVSQSNVMEMMGSA